MFVVIKSKEIATNMGLLHDENIYGDGINMFNCRSFWYDPETNLRYRCSDLYLIDSL